MKFEKNSNSSILNEFNLSTESLFAFYVAKKVPHEKSLCLTQADKIKSFVICGGDHNLFEAYQSWVLAKDQSSFDILLGKLIEEKSYESFSAVYNFVEKSKYKSSLKVSKDFLYVLRSFDQVCFDALKTFELRVVRLSKTNLPNFENSVEMQEKIGSFSDFIEECNFWGLIVGNEIVGVCDALVNFSNYASIQQVYVLSKLRGKGLSKILLTAVLTELMKEFSVLTYIVSETNLPSIKLAESLGFRKELELADVFIK